MTDDHVPLRVPRHLPDLLVHLRRDHGTTLRQGSAETLSEFGNRVREHHARQHAPGGPHAHLPHADH